MGLALCLGMTQKTNKEDVALADFQKKVHKPQKRLFI